MASRIRYWSILNYWNGALMGIAVALLWNDNNIIIAGCFMLAVIMLGFAGFARVT